MGLIRTLNALTNHPIGRLDRLATVRGFFAWQFGSRLAPGPVAVPFVNDTQLLVRRGQHGATGAVYVGMLEFEDMAFAAHFLRPDDFFLDVGANMGVYSVLGGAVGARGVAFEPVPGTYAHLHTNLRINDLASRIDARNAGVGRAPGTLRFTTGLDAINHVATSNDKGAIAELPVVTLDASVRETPVFIKMDVEGFETDALAGAGRILADATLQAILIELNGAGARYGHSDDAIHAQLLGLGFEPATYEPFSRALARRAGHATSGNTLYVRGFDEVAARVRSAPKFRIKGREI